MKILYTIITLLITFLPSYLTWALPECEGSPHEGKEKTEVSHWTNCLGIFSWEDRLQYNGEWKKGNIHGHGSAIFPNKDNYIGEWKHNKKDGHGTYTWNSGEF